MAHVAAAKETGLPAMSARFALITFGAAATTATDDQDNTVRAGTRGCQKGSEGGGGGDQTTFDHLPESPEVTYLPKP